MKRFHILLITLSLTIFCSQIEAQEIGRGRLLRKIRDDIFGSPQTPSAQQAPQPTPTLAPGVRPQGGVNQQRGNPQGANQQSVINRQSVMNRQGANLSPQQMQQMRLQQQQLRQQQVRAQQMRTPTPANPNARNQQGQYRQQQNRNFVPPQQQAGIRQPTPAKRPNASRTTPRSNVSARPSASSRPTAASNRAPERSAANQNAGGGFGVELIARGEKVLVNQLIPGGNAAKAGLKLGDTVTGVGGVDISSVDDFEDITAEMGQGDQIEFSVASRGKKDKVLIQFGELPELEQAEAGDDEIDTGYRGRPDSPGGMRSVLNDNTSGNASNSMRTSDASGLYGNRPADGGNPAILQRQLETQQQTIERLELELRQIRAQQSGYSPQSQTAPANRRPSYSVPTHNAPSIAPQSSGPPISAPSIQAPGR